MPDQNDAGSSPTPSAIGASAIVGRSSVCTQIADTYLDRGD
jgi:hypothetical protein